MNRDEYLSELYGRLRQRMGAAELDHLMKYYEEYFDEAGAEREQEVMNELGTPAQLSARILGGQTGNGSAGYHYQQVAVPRNWTTGKIIALVCLSPLWVPLVMALPVAAIGVVFGVGFGGLGLIAGGIFSAWCGFTAIFTPGFTTAMFFGGLGLLLAGIGITMVAGAIAFGRVLFKAVASFCRWLFVGRKVWVEA